MEPSQASILRLLRPGTTQVNALEEIVSTYRQMKVGLQLVTAFKPDVKSLA
jgi:hypothetical protein